MRTFCVLYPGWGLFLPYNLLLHQDPAFQTSAVVDHIVVLPVKPPVKLDFDDNLEVPSSSSEEGSNLTRSLASTSTSTSSSSSPVFRAVALAWLAEFVKKHERTTQSWDVVKDLVLLLYTNGGYVMLLR